MQHVVLREMTGAPLDVNLPHEEYCAAVKQCSCSWKQHPRLSVEKSTGGISLHRNRVRICASVSLLARGESTPLHMAAIECPSIKALLAAGRIRYRVVGRPDEPAPTGAPEKAPEVAPQRKMKKNKAEG